MILRIGMPTNEGTLSKAVLTGITCGGTCDPCGGADFWTRFVAEATCGTCGAADLWTRFVAGASCGGAGFWLDDVAWRNGSSLGRSLAAS